MKILEGKKEQANKIYQQYGNDSMGKEESAKTFDEVQAEKVTPEIKNVMEESVETKDEADC